MAHRQAASGIAKAAIVLGIVNVVLVIVAFTALSAGGLTWYGG